MRVLLTVMVVVLASPVTAQEATYVRCTTIEALMDVDDVRQEHGDLVAGYYVGYVPECEEVSAETPYSDIWHTEDPRVARIVAPFTPEGEPSWDQGFVLWDEWREARR